MDAGSGGARYGVALDDAVALIRAAAPSATPESVSLSNAFGRVLLAPVVAQRDQPPFDASAMDGYAIADGPAPEGEGEDEGEFSFTLTGMSRAGAGFAGTVGPGEAVRILTGAPVPEGATRVVIQENVRVTDDRVFVASGTLHGETHIRPKGGDFRAGEGLLEAGRRLDGWTLALAASAGVAELCVAKKPVVAVMATGDELVPPGAVPRPDQIFESASTAVRTLIVDWGGEAVALDAAADTSEAILESLYDVKADLIVTIGGASVGDHDHVRGALARLGLDLSFASLNLKPGKPAAFGRLADGRHCLILPGNPASCFVTAELLLRPFIEAMTGQAAAPSLETALCEAPLPATGPRETWMRGHVRVDADGHQYVTAFSDQDSSLISVFARANCLIRRPAGSPALTSGQAVILRRLRRL